MARKNAKPRKLCPKGVAEDCLYCVRQRGRIWEVLDPKENGIDEATTEKEATDIADSFISQCEASRSGYGKQQQKTKQARLQQAVNFHYRGGPFSW